MSSSLPALTPRKVIRALKRAGFFVHHSTGSHYILKHSTNDSLRVTVLPQPRPQAPDP